MWPSTLSGRLLIVALVGRCPANKLIRRGPLPYRRSFPHKGMRLPGLCGISSRFRLLSPCMGQVAHALLTRPPLSHPGARPEGLLPACFVRLACVRHAASVHPEPGSNSLNKFSCQSLLAFRCTFRALLFFGLLLPDFNLSTAIFPKRVLSDSL